MEPSLPLQRSTAWCYDLRLQEPRFVEGFNCQVVISQEQPALLCIWISIWMESDVVRAVVDLAMPSLALFPESDHKVSMIAVLCRLRLKQTSRSFSV